MEANGCCSATIYKYICYELLAEDGRFDSSYKWGQKMAATNCTARYSQLLIYARDLSDFLLTKLKNVSLLNLRRLSSHFDTITRSVKGNLLIYIVLVLTLRQLRDK
jgi:hypothetical protein